MSTLRTKEQRFSAISRVQNELINLKFKSKSRIRTTITKTPRLAFGTSAIMSLDLGSVVLIKSVSTDKTGLTIEFHSTIDCTDEDPINFTLDSSPSSPEGLVHILPDVPFRRMIAHNGDTTEKPFIYVKVTNSNVTETSFFVKIDYFDMSEVVFQRIYPKFSITSELRNLIIPRIVTPISGYTFDKLTDEYSADPIPNLADSSQYIGYNEVSVYPNVGYLASPVSVINNNLSKIVYYSKYFQPEGEYKIYFEVPTLDDPRRELLKDYNVFPENLDTSEVTFRLKDEVTEYVHSLHIDTTLGDRGNFASKMIVFSIRNNQVLNQPIVINSDLGS